MAPTEPVVLASLIRQLVQSIDADLVMVAHLRDQTATDPIAWLDSARRKVRDLSALLAAPVQAPEKEEDTRGEAMGDGNDSPTAANNEACQPYNAPRNWETFFGGAVRGEAPPEPAQKALAFLRIWANSYLLNGNYWDIPQTMGSTLNHAIRILEEALRAPREQPMSDSPAISLSSEYEQFNGPADYVMLASGAIVHQNGVPVLLMTGALVRVAHGNMSQLVGHHLCPVPQPPTT